jgi:hypothetical protein
MWGTLWAFATYPMKNGDAEMRQKGAKSCKKGQFYSLSGKDSNLHYGIGIIGLIIVSHPYSFRDDSLVYGHIRTRV